MSDVLTSILERKAREVLRRARRSWAMVEGSKGTAFDPSRLRRVGRVPHVIAEIKHRSPSAGMIRPRVVGGVEAIARGYERGGASAISVLADGPGFGGSVLDVRRAARVVSIPILFKEFVLSEVQLDVARLAGASLVLLIVRALTPQRLSQLIRAAHARGLSPVVEAADVEELAQAIDSEAQIVGMNARDLRSFAVDPGAALSALERVPTDRVAVFMSGIERGTDLRRAAEGRADAVLVGSSLMRAEDPGAQLGLLLGEV